MASVANVSAALLLPSEPERIRSSRGCPYTKHRTNLTKFKRKENEMKN